MLGEDYWRDGAAGANVTGVFNKISLKLDVNYCSWGVGYRHRWAQSAMDRWIDTDTIDRYYRSILSIDTISHDDHR
jgi:hypothetical protein